MVLKNRQSVVFSFEDKVSNNRIIGLLYKQLSVYIPGLETQTIFVERKGLLAVKDEVLLFMKRDWILLIQVD